MKNFAHNGVDHATDLEKSVHATQNPRLMIIIISIVVAGIIVASIYLLQKRTANQVVKKDKE